MRPEGFSPAFVLPVVNYMGEYDNDGDANSSIVARGFTLREGMQYWNKTFLSMMVYNGTVWVAISAGGGPPPSSQVFNESFTGPGATFTLTTSYVGGTTRVFLNGVRQKRGVSDDYIEGPGGGQVTFNSATISGDQVLVDYEVP